jgi:glutamate synthase domain-containing protein 1
MRENIYSDDKVFDACALFGVMDTTGRRFGVQDVIAAIANMGERGNGLGGGFAIYGLYPRYADLYAFHAMCANWAALDNLKDFLEGHFSLVHEEEIPHRSTPGITDPPILWRYFLHVNPHQLEGGETEQDYIVHQVMTINTSLEGTYVFSSGKDMGGFKGVGYPEQLAEFFCLEEYEGYIWTAHSRFPTNTPGWWAGAHPFSILDWAVVHNGEISSYGTNRRYLEMHGYHCTMRTDTEVVAYAADLLMRRHNLPIEIAAKVLAPPLWDELERESGEQKELYCALRQVYGSLLLNGPFTVIITRQGEMIGLTDRIRLRPLTAAVKEDLLYLSSEEAAIRLVCPQPDDVWTPVGGEPIIGRLRVRPGRQPQRKLTAEAAEKAKENILSPWPAGASQGGLRSLRSLR